ncbi:MAG: hypothetical protein WC730_03705 [Patescibacteria group bacterium]|jgi:hypothetical protein
MKKSTHYADLLFFFLLTATAAVIFAFFFAMVSIPVFRAIFLI